MPNPIDRIVPGAEIVIRPGAVVRHRPQLSLMLIDTLTRWAFAEAAVGDALAAILWEDAGPVIRQFINKPNSKRQREFLLEHAEQQLTAEDLETLQVLLQLFEEDFRQRNRLAHWLSGCSPQIADGILLMNPSERWSHAAADYAWIHEALNRTAYEDNPPGRPGLEPRRDRVFVYKAADFQRIGRSISELIWVFDVFTEMYCAVAGHDAARARGYARLQTSPRFLEARRRHEDRARSAPEVPQSQSDAKPRRRLLSHLPRFLARFFGGTD